MLSLEKIQEFQDCFERGELTDEMMKDCLPDIILYAKFYFQAQNLVSKYSRLSINKSCKLNENNLTGPDSKIFYQK